MDTRKSMFAFIREEMRNADAEKIYYYGNRIDAGTLLSHIDAVAAFLSKKGVGKGDSVGICLPNIPQAAIALYAVNKIGAVANVMHPKIGSESLKEIAARTKTKALFLFDRFLKPHLSEPMGGVTVVYCRMSDYMPGIKKLFRFTEPFMGMSECVPFLAALKERGAEEAVSDGTEPAVYLHSSGTTGAPKTVVLSSYAFNELAANVFDSVKDVCRITEDFGVLMILPLFHGFGLGICVHLALVKARVIMVPLFRARATVRLMKREPVNVIPGVPGMFRRLLEQKGFKGEFLKNIKLMFCGGDRLEPRLKRAFEERLVSFGCDTPIMEGYGLSEVASVATINTFAPGNGSLGRGISKVMLKAVKDGGDCVPGETGEIYISSPSVMNGYLGGEDDRVTEADGRRWLATGDVGYLDEDGCLFFRERIKRIAKIGGVNVFPQEIEETAARFRGVKQACAVRTEFNGKAAIKLIIVTENRADGRFKSELSSFIRRELTPYAVPKIIEELPSIRKNALGKSDYRFYETQA